MALPVVEVSAGGVEYTNPDALTAIYSGEFQTFDDREKLPVTAIEICRSWRHDGESKAKVAHGATGGMTMPFESRTFHELKHWANQAYERLPKCDRCGEVLPMVWSVHPDLPDQRFCREYCAEAAATAA